MIHRSLTLVVSLVLATSLFGQASPVQFSASARVNPSPVGSTVSFDVAATAVVSLNTGCGLSAVRAGSPSGPVVFAPFFCPGIFLQVGPSTLNRPVQWGGTDNSGSAVPAGLYFVEISWRDQSGLAGTTHVPVQLEDPANPYPVVLSTMSTSSIGTTMSIDITAPTRVASLVTVAASFTTNSGQNFGPGVDLALDNDFLFGLSFPTSNPAFFGGFANVIGSNGGAAAPISVTIPNDPALRFLPLALQAVSVDFAAPPADFVVFSNPLTFILQ